MDPELPLQPVMPDTPDPYMEWLEYWIVTNILEETKEQEDDN